MRLNINFLGYPLIFLVLIMGSAGLRAQESPDQISSRSVVSISARSARGTSTGSGFVWFKPNYVVTALHVVAGARQIDVYSEYKKKGTGAKVFRVNREADLALLRLDEALGVPPLSIAGVSPNSREEFYIWGYPRDVAKMSGDHIRFTRSLSGTPTLKYIFKTVRQYKKIVGSQGYPGINAQILRISSTIQPGHSGAPIMNKKGKVVGIGDGGLRQGLSRINWAIPAMTYLPTLPHSKDPHPDKASVQASLLGHHVTDGAVVRMGSKSSLEKVGTVALREVMATVDTELADIYTDLDQQAVRETGKSLAPAGIDIYEDYQTGATVAVPAGFPVQYDSATRLLKTSYQGGGQVDMMIQIVMNDSPEEGMDALSGFESMLFGITAWREDPQIPDEDEWIAEDSTLFLSRFRYRPDENDQAIDEMNATLILDGSDFLGTAVIARNVPALNRDARYQFYVMHMCAELADFSIE